MIMNEKEKSWSQKWDQLFFWVKITYLKPHCNLRLTNCKENFLVCNRNFLLNCDHQREGIPPAKGE